MKKINQKSGKTALLWILLAALAAVIAAVAVMIFMPAPSEEAPPESDGKLYWNVERTQYEDMLSGTSTRKADEDGVYTVMFSVQGEQVKLSTADSGLVDEIDSMRVMGLAFDKDGMICDVLSLQELSLGKAAYQFYVESVKDGAVAANSSKDLDGEAAQLTLDENVQIYYTATADMLCGMTTDIREKDRILGVSDTQGRVTHVYVIERTYTGTKEMRYCQHCQKETAWWSWDSSNAVPDIGGHFYLTGDISTSKQCNIPANTSIVLDLQGHVINGNANRRIYATWGEGAYLGIMDSSSAQTGKLVGEGTQFDQGGVIWARYGTVELYGGTVDASQVYTLKNGAAVYVRTGAIFNMYGGTIRGGISKAITDEAGNIVNGRGGNVYVGGTFNMYGGLIQDGLALGIYHDNTSTMGIGGNLYVADTGIVNISGGVIENGEATGGGGNIYTMGQVNIKGNVTVSGGIAEGPKKNGGSIYVYKTGVFNMEGGTISGGKTALGSGGNICSTGTVNLTDCIIENGSAHQYGNGIYATTGVLNVADSTVTDGMRVGKDVDFALLGTNKVTGLELPSGSVINVDGLAADSAIAITASGYFTEKTSNNCAGCFKADGYSASVIYTGQRLFVGRSGCLCGKSDHAGWCDGTKHLWKAWTEDETLPTEDGYYYLTKNVTRKYQTNIGNTKEKTVVNLTLDLNGKTVTATKGKRVFFVAAGSTLSVTDTGANGQLKSKGSVIQNGGIFMVGSDSVMNLYAGTIVGTDTLKSESGNGDGGAGSVIGTLNMYGGSITGGVAERHGGCLTVSGTLNLYGGSISDGKAINLGGNIYCSGQVNIYGGSVSGGKAGTSTSDNILVAKGKTLTVSGGFVDGGVRQAGTAIVVLKDNPVITGSGISLADGTRVTVEGTLDKTAQVVVSKDGTWLYFADTAIPENAAAFTVPEGYEIKFDETRNQLYYAKLPVYAEHSHSQGEQWTEWSGTEAFTDGGFYCLTQDITMEKTVTVKAITATLCLNGYTITGAENLRTFFIRDGATLNIHDCSAEHTGKVQAVGTYTENGANIMVGSNSTLNLYGGTVCGGSNAQTSGLHGGNICVLGAFHMYGGCVEGGQAGGNGGNLYSTAAGEICLYDGQLRGGIAGNLGGNICTSGTLQILGGSISQGQSVNAAANNLITMTTAICTISGGEIDGGVRIASDAGVVMEHCPVITGTGINLGTGKYITIAGTLEQESQVFVTKDGSWLYFANTEIPENAAAFQVPEGYEVLFDEERNQLYYAVIPEESEHSHGDQLQWNSWNGDVAALGAGGAFVLEEALTLTDTVALSGDKNSPVVIDLCLNGQTLTAPENKQAFNLGAGYTLNIHDCSEEKTGSICGNGTVTGTGGVLRIGGEATVNQYGGTITDGHATGNGGNIVMYSTAKYNLHDGNLANGRAGNLGGNIQVGNGSVFTMYKGNVEGGVADGNTQAANVIMTAAGTIDLHGGRIQGGMRLTAGTLNLSGSIQITGGATNLSVKAKTKVIQVGALEEGALIGITLSGSDTDGAGIVAYNVAEGMEIYFQSDDPRYTAQRVKSNSVLKLA